MLTKSFATLLVTDIIKTYLLSVTGIVNDTAFLCFNCVVYFIADNNINSFVFAKNYGRTTCTCWVF